MASKKKTQQTPHPGLSESQPFEALMGQLEGIVGRLEDGELSLEDSLASYESGIGLVREAQSRLDAMDARLEQLTRDGRVVPLAIDDISAQDASLRQPPPAAENEFDEDTNF